MRTTIFSLTTILVFLNSFLCAANPTSSKEKSSYFRIEISFSFPKETSLQLAPATPSEATFEDVEKNATTDLFTKEIKSLAPVTPKEASFDDMISSYTMESQVLSPLTPREATFDDSIGK